MSDEEVKVKVTDKRHWVHADEDIDDTDVSEIDRLPTYVEKLQAQMEENDKKLKEYIAAYKEKMLENDQFRARLEKDIDRRVENKLAGILRDILPVMDNLDLAVDHARTTNDANGLIEGVTMIKSGFLGILSRAGMEEVECLGTPFDPSIAEAISVEEVTEESKDGRVLQILQPGYRLGGMLLRPAKVKVGKKV